MLKRIFYDFGPKIDPKITKKQPKIDLKLRYFSVSAPRALRERFFEDFREIFASRAQAANLENRAPVQARARF